MTVRPYSFTVAQDDAGLRLDQLLAKRVPGLSRRTARKVLLIGGVFVERTRIKIGSKVIQPGRTVSVYVGGALGIVSDAEKQARGRGGGASDLLKDLLKIGRATPGIDLEVAGGDGGNAGLVVKSMAHGLPRAQIRATERQVSHRWATPDRAIP